MRRLTSKEQSILVKTINEAFEASRGTDHWMSYDSEVHSKVVNDKGKTIGWHFIGHCVLPNYFDPMTHEFAPSLYYKEVKGSKWIYNDREGCRYMVTPAIEALF